MKLIFAILILLSTAACGDGTTTPKPIEENGIFPALIGGAIADLKEWPASFFGTSGNAGCSGTVIGERVYFTAAHCTSNGAKVKFSNGPHTYTATCTHHPEYRGNSTADWNVCLIETKFEGGPLEVVNTDASLPSVGEYLTLTGYGCQKWNGAIDGKLRIGESPVTSLPSGSNYDIVTKGKAALCSGDSGGALYRRTNDGKRVLMAVNSRSNTTTTSYMPSVALPTAQKFLADWAKAKGVEICGIHPSAKNCRGVTPQLEKLFALDLPGAKLTGEMKTGFEKYRDFVEDEIRKLILSLKL